MESLVTLRRHAHPEGISMTIGETIDPISLGGTRCLALTIEGEGVLSNLDTTITVEVQQGVDLRTKGDLLTFHMALDQKGKVMVIRVVMNRTGDLQAPDLGRVVNNTEAHLPH